MEKIPFHFRQSTADHINLMCSRVKQHKSVKQHESVKKHESAKLMNQSNSMNQPNSRSSHSFHDRPAAGRLRMKLIPGSLQGKTIIKLLFSYNRPLVDAVKKVPGRRWNPEKRFWYIPEDQFHLDTLLSKLGAMAEIDDSALRAGRVTDAEIPPLYLEKLIVKRYSPNTIKTYLSYMKAFTEEFGLQALPTVTAQQINEYILRLIDTEGSGR